MTDDPGEDPLENEAESGSESGYSRIFKSLLRRDGRKRGSAAPPPSKSSISIDHGRFLPGTLLAGRYRIVALAGKGGMGEVYRSDDLSLGQPVALKFLPESLARREENLERFRNEVRLARQVSHPNVCRVYDIGEAEGQHFISMEYVDGEDLASLLRRIGRFPKDTAVDMARQLCCALAAAHEKGVLHRDLKPANVMIDGRGKVLITDFGLAALTSELAGNELRVGTPAYMAPEQLEARDVSVRSDIYSLGLVLFEMTTGRPAFTASSLGELMELRRKSSPPTPSSIVGHLDPSLERLIVKCLEPEPENRPASALAVLAALPGVDPLAAAIAAGETPSPELVAAAGSAHPGLRPGRGAAWLAVILVGLVAIAWLADRVAPIGSLKLKPDQLELKAIQIIRGQGYVEEPEDSAYGFSYGEHATDSRATELSFWYRESPDPLTPVGRFDSIVSLEDPAPVVPGMIRVELDATGRLLSFLAVPRRRAENDSARGVLPDARALFELAGLQLERFEERSPVTWTPPVFADSTRTWTSRRGQTRVDAASHYGRWVVFRVSEPGREEVHRGPAFRWLPGSGYKSSVAWTLKNALVLTILIGAVVLARRNLRLGRSDRKGALRLALYIFCLRALVWLFEASHVRDFSLELDLVFDAVGKVIFLAFRTWLYYLALEPYVRRLWPQALTSWTRLIDGRLQDPLVGRSVLIGTGFGVLWVLFGLLGGMFEDILVDGDARQSHLHPSTLLGARHLVAQFLHFQYWAVLAGLVALLFLLLLRTLLLRRSLVTITFVVFTALVTSLGSGSYSEWLTGCVVGGSVVLLLTSFGLVSCIAAFFSFFLLIHFPVTGDFSTWYSGHGLFALVAVAVLGGLGFFNSIRFNVIRQKSP